MERKQFVEELSKEKSDTSEWKKIIEATCVKDGQITKGILTAEECAELIKEVSKMARCKGNKMDLLQELADVFICGMFQCFFYGFSKEVIIKAVSVKL